MWDRRFRLSNPTNGDGPRAPRQQVVWVDALRGVLVVVFAAAGLRGDRLQRTAPLRYSASPPPGRRQSTPAVIVALNNTGPGSSARPGIRGLRGASREEPCAPNLPSPGRRHRPRHARRRAPAAPPNSILTSTPSSPRMATGSRPSPRAHFTIPLSPSTLQQPRRALRGLRTAAQDRLRRIHRQSRREASAIRAVAG